MVEHATVNRRVEGSSPSSGAIFIQPWMLGRLISPWAGTSPKTANLQWNLQWIGVGLKVLRIIEPHVHTLAYAA